MTLSPASGFGAPFAQLVDQIFEREAGGAGARDGVRRDLVELALSFRVGMGKLLCADEGAGSLLGVEQAAQFQLAVGAHDSVGVDGEIDGKLAYGGQLASGGESARRDGPAHLVDDLAIDGDSAMGVEAKAKGRFGVADHSVL